MQQHQAQQQRHIPASTRLGICGARAAALLTLAAGVWELLQSVTDRLGPLSYVIAVAACVCAILALLLMRGQGWTRSDRRGRRGHL